MAMVKALLREIMKSKKDKKVVNKYIIMIEVEALRKGKMLLCITGQESISMLQLQEV